MTKFLPVSFFILQYIGLWQPVHWPAGWRTRVYTLFTMFSFTLLYVDTGSQIVDCFETATTISEYADHSFILLTMIGICVKMASLIKNRQSIVELINILQSGSFETRTQEEDQIRMSFENLMKWRTILFGIFVQMGTFNLFVTSLIYLAPHRITITRLYLPWNTKTFLGYWVAWVLQCISRWFGGPVNVACDSLVSGLLYRAAAQFKILQLRLKDLAALGSGDKKTSGAEELQAKKITDLVRQHLEIIQIVAKLNDIFGFVIFMQYCVSSTVLCVTVFVFAQVKVFDTHCAMMITYTGCLYFQVYLLCSAGTEMTAQSGKFTSYVYMCNWGELSVRTKKSLLLMMMRSYRPLKFTSWRLIDLSIESFSQIVKFSYSAYNVLAQGQ